MISIEKMAAILRKTETDFDAEALVAIRTANKILKNAKLNWADWLQLISKNAAAENNQHNSFRDARDWARERHYTDDDAFDKWQPNLELGKIRLMYAAISQSKISIARREAAKSIYEFFCKNYKLTKKQWKYFNDIYASTGRRN